MTQMQWHWLHGVLLPGAAAAARAAAVAVAAAAVTPTAAVAVRNAHFGHRA